MFQVESGQLDAGDVILAVGKADSLTGTVLRENGSPAAGARVSIDLEAQAGRSSFRLQRSGAVTDAAGDFTIPKVLEGTYRATATLGVWSGRQIVTIADGVATAAQIIITGRRALAGEVQFVPARSDCSQATVLALPLDGEEPSDAWPISAPVSDDGTFELRGVRGRIKAELRCGPPAGYARIVEARIGAASTNDEIDLSRVPREARLVMKVEPRSSTVTFDVAADDRVTCGGIVVVAAAAGRLWAPPFQQVWVLPVHNDSADIHGLPPGHYFAFHEPPRMPAEVTNADYLERVKQASAVSFEVSHPRLRLTIPCR